MQEEWWNPPVETRRRRSRHGLREQFHAEPALAAPASMEYPRTTQEPLPEMPGSFNNEEYSDTMPLLSTENTPIPKQTRFHNLIEVDEVPAPTRPSRSRQPTVEDELEYPHYAPLPADENSSHKSYPSRTEAEMLDSCIATLIEMGFGYDGVTGELDMPKLEVVATMANGVVDDAVTIMEEDARATGNIRL